MPEIFDFYFWVTASHMPLTLGRKDWKTGTGTGRGLGGGGGQDRILDWDLGDRRGWPHPPLTLLPIPHTCTHICHITPTHTQRKAVDGTSLPGKLPLFMALFHPFAKLFFFFTFYLHFCTAMPCLPFLPSYYVYHALLHCIYIHIHAYLVMYFLYSLYTSLSQIISIHPHLINLPLSTTNFPFSPLAGRQEQAILFLQPSHILALFALPRLLTTASCALVPLPVAVILCLPFSDKTDRQEYLFSNMTSVFSMSDEWMTG